MDWRATVFRLMVAGLFVLTTGCERTGGPSRYEAFGGDITGLRAETGEVSVQVRRGASALTVQCVVTRDSELYVNDRLCGLEQLRVGDAIDLIVTRDPDPQVVRFAVAFGYVHRAVAPPRPPDFRRTGG